MAVACLAAPAAASAQSDISVAELPPARPVSAYQVAPRPASAHSVSTEAAPVRTNAIREQAVKTAAPKTAKLALATTTTASRPGKTFNPDTAPRWIVAATTTGQTTAPIAAGTPMPSKRWKPEKRWAVSPVIGTDGAGGELSYQATRGLVFRGRFTWLGIRHNQTYEQIRYGGRLKFATGGAFIDIHPLPGWAHPFMLTGGVMKGQRRLEIIATPQNVVTLGGHTYTAAQTGSLTGYIQAPDSAPFVGLGWDNTFDSQGAFGFKFIAGTTITSRPDVQLTANGTSAALNAALQADLAAERSKIKDMTDYLRFYPVVSTGLTYKF